MKTSLLGIVASAVLLTTANGCKDQEEPASDDINPVAGSVAQVSSDSLTTSIGTALAIDRATISPRVAWSEFTVFDDQSAALGGHEDDRAVVLRTANAGRSWSSSKEKATSWARWSFDAEGGATLLTGKLDGKSSDKAARAKEVALWMLKKGTKTLRGPLTLPESLTPTTSLPSQSRAASLGASQASFMTGDPNPRLVWAGESTSISKPLGAGHWLHEPFGIPPQLVSIRGAALEVRPWPKPNQPLKKPTVVTGFKAGPATAASMRAGRRCTHGSMSFRRAVDGLQKPYVLAIAPNRSLAIALPPHAGKLLGCSSKAVVVVLKDPKKKTPKLLRCDLSGKCTASSNAPFVPWGGEYKRRMWAVPTNQGVVAAMQLTAGSRWGSYISYSLDGGKRFETMREMGQGRGQSPMRIKSLLSLGSRILLLFTADTPNDKNSDRSYYVMTSSDHGQTWSAP